MMSLSLELTNGIPLDGIGSLIQYPREPFQFWFNGPIGTGLSAEDPTATSKRIAADEGEQFSGVVNSDRHCVVSQGPRIVVGH